ncbi:Vacuolar protein sorting-associated protein 8 [Rhizina undulata]
MSSKPDESLVLASDTNEADEVFAVAEEISELPRNEDTSDRNGEQLQTSKVLEYLQEAREEGAGDINGTGFRGYKQVDNTQEDHDLPSATNRVSSPAESYSTPDDTPSLHGSINSSLASSAFGSRFSPSPSLRAFDRRFQSRLQPPPPLQSPSSRALSPALLGIHSRSSSLGSRTDAIPFGELEDKSAPWDVVRWTKLKKITSQVFSEAGRRSFGSPTCITVSATIALGTSKGIILIFDYHQTLKSIIGPGTKAAECGPITALAVSADHTTIAGGHSSGDIFTWELAKPSRPFLQISPLSVSQMENRKADGHVEGASVLHLGFLGTRHTALVSADDRGMAFSHLATRGLGPVARIVKTTRILGRYPMDIPPSGRSRKPSSVLAFSVLPLGTSQQPTDSMGLVAMLTPYLLVIVSTTPVAQTQYKTARPKEVASDAALSGCLAWYPSVKLKSGQSSIASNSNYSNARLVYCWSNVLTLSELSIAESDEPEDPNRPPTLEFKAKSRFRCDEAIVAVQWINRQVVGVLTVTQRLIILEDTSLRVTETFDLMPKHILHMDLFSENLGPLVGRMGEEASMHSHVADAFYNSYKTYKGRMFLLCSYEVSVGALSNWADRLLAMMEVGDFIGAIRLATAYYIGETNKLTIGLPDEASLRHAIVQEKLLEMMSASLRYAFGKNKNSSRTEALGKEQLQDLAAACFEACLSMDTTDFLFEETFEYFEEGSEEGIFLETLEPHILEGRISTFPPTIVKALIRHYTSLELESRLEEMICHMDTRTLDIDQVTALCKQHNLYDAMIYVWNRALGDYITPLMDLLTLMIPLVSNGVAQEQDPIIAVNALKIFPYLSYTLTGRVYPTGEDLTEPENSTAKAAIYYFLFLGTTVTWPKKGGRAFLSRHDRGPEPSFPYLRLILKFDAPSFLSVLNEAFEDPFLNGVMDFANGHKQEISEDQVFGRSVNRQYIISILLEVMSPTDFPRQDTIYLNMFIARNLPKYPQFVLLSGSALHRVLVGLCDYPSEDIADDCQLSAEYLLTVYRPPDLDQLIALFSNAGFYRVLKSIFRAEKQYARLVRIYFEDRESRDTIFDCIGDCLRPRSSLTDRQKDEVRQVIKQNARTLIETDEIRTARIINEYAPELHAVFLDSVQDRPEDQFLYLRTILEPSDGREGPELKRSAAMNNTFFVELYVRLMCEYHSQHVAEYVGKLQSGDLRLEKVLPAMEDNGVMDAAVLLMAREGQIRQAMDRLTAHMETLQAVLIGLLAAERNTRDLRPSDVAVAETLKSLKKYAQVGVWLCQGQMKNGKRLQKIPTPKRRSEKDPLSKEELLWLDLVDTVVRIAKNSISILNKPPVNGMDIELNRSAGSKINTELDKPSIINSMRLFVQDAFSALLAATSSSQSVSFLRILRAFLERASIASPSLADLRNVLGGVFEAYLYEEQLLSLANRLLGKDLFVHVDEMATLRQRGWRPAGQMCEACGKRLWGPGAAGGIYGAWERTRLDSMRKLETLREQRRIEAQQVPLSAVARGKSRAMEGDFKESEGGNFGGGEPSGEAGGGESGELVLFSCRHIFHRKCLDNLQANQSLDWAFKCVVCGHDEM